MSKKHSFLSNLMMLHRQKKNQKEGNLVQFKPKSTNFNQKEGNLEEKRLFCKKKEPIFLLLQCYRGYFFRRKCPIWLKNNQIFRLYVLPAVQCSYRKLKIRDFELIQVRTLHHTIQCEIGLEVKCTYVRTFQYFFPYFP